MAPAKEFSAGKLGLSAVRAQPDGSQTYASGGDASLHVYPSPAHAGEKGISPLAGGGKVAWFKDPDGNTFAVEGE
jgi:hypothetical protein